MKTTTKKEVTGTQGVNASQNKATASNNAKPVNGTAVPAAKTEAVVPLHKPLGRPQTIDEQMKYFDGLSQLVSIKRRFEAHKEAILELHVSDDEIAAFGAEKRTVAKIMLIDENDNEYTINNPLLVQEVQMHLVNVLDRRLADCNHKILNYGN